jgi:hypothetical protein
MHPLSTSSLALMLDCCAQGTHRRVKAMVKKLTLARTVYTLDTAPPTRRLPAGLILTILVIALGLAAVRMTS